MLIELYFYLTYIHVGPTLLIHNLLCTELQTKEYIDHNIFLLGLLVVHKLSI